MENKILPAQTPSQTDPTSPQTPEAKDRNPETPPPAKKPVGFAALALKPGGLEKIKAIAHKGGKAAHAQGTAHEFTSEEAREAGKRGGKATHAKKRAAKEGA